MKNQFPLNKISWLPFCLSVAVVLFDACSDESFWKIEPEADFTITWLTPDNQAGPPPCSATLTNTTNTRGLVTSYVWTVNGVEIATSKDANYSFIASETYTVRLTATNCNTSQSKENTVTIPEMKVSGITISPSDDVSVVEGKTITLTATVTPVDAANKTITWDADNTGIATVNAQTGVVTGVSVGTTTIRATATDGSGVTAGKNVTVLKADSEVELKGIKMVPIKAGTFYMGSPSSEPERSSNEIPQHGVALSAFRLSAYAITNEQYCRFLNDRGIDGNGQGTVSGFSGTHQLIYSHNLGANYASGQWRPQDGYADHPVVYVTWYGAKAFCEWIGGRLPTEAEWEYACRAGTVTPFNTGNNLTTSQANYDGNYPYNRNPNGTYLGHTQPVGSYAPNAWGLYEMHGNVREWCGDWYSDGYGDFPNGAVDDPQGPDTGVRRVVRGGSWGSAAGGCRSAARAASGPDGCSDYQGFRLAAAPFQLTD